MFCTVSMLAWLYAPRLYPFLADPSPRSHRLAPQNARGPVCLVAGRTTVAKENEEVEAQQDSESAIWESCGFMATKEEKVTFREGLIFE
jgi:hypothetical protein